VDPDNRRPVDYAVRTALLDGLRARMARGDLAALAAELLAEWQDGRIKLYTAHRALAFRRSAPALFQAGRHVPLAGRGRAADSVCAFARQDGEAMAITVVPRLAARVTKNGAALPLGLDAWHDTALALPPGAPDAYTDLLSGLRVEAVSREDRPVLAVADVLAAFPVALLVPAGRLP
jgi:(1->4)-alpha-D-glucan 1-alpha-D-glucosylmutase